MQLPIYRYLTEKRWREDGALDLLVSFIIHGALEGCPWHSPLRNMLAYAICHMEA